MRVSTRFLLALALVSCGGDDDPAGSADASPYYCDLVTPCTDSVRSFCDLEGSYPDSQGQPNTCIAPPAEVECDANRPCTDEAKPACTSRGQCVECVNYSTCNADEPVCQLSTNTCGPCRLGDSDAVCAAIDLLQPFCSPRGECDECLESSDCSVNTAPVCDPVEYYCRGCTNGEECSTGNCNVDTGVCIQPT